MAIETFKNAKDYLLIGLMAMVVKIGWDIRDKVEQLHDDSIEKTYEISNVKGGIERHEKKNHEQDERLTRIEAILHDNDVRPKRTQTADKEN